MSRGMVWKQNKYRVGPKEERTYDGIVFDSKREMNRWKELMLLRGAGEIIELERQVRIPLHAKGGDMVGHYVLDFHYREKKSGKVHREDAKGYSTALYKWKKRHVEAEYGFTIEEV